jgi:hypothetical protein
LTPMLLFVSKSPLGVAKPHRNVREMRLVLIRTRHKIILLRFNAFA